MMYHGSRYLRKLDVSFIFLIFINYTLCHLLESHHGCNSNRVPQCIVSWNDIKNKGGRVVRRCWVNFQCRGILLFWMTVGQGPTALAVGAGGGCLDIFTLIYPFSPLSPSLWEAARYRLKYCLKRPLDPKTTNQPTYNKYKKKLIRFSFLSELR